MAATGTRRRRGAVILLAAVFVTSLMPAQPARAASISVCATGCDHASVQAAIDAASPGDTILLGAQTFTETINVDRDLTIRGTGAASSTIDGDAAGSVVTVLTGVSLRLEQLAVRNGRTAGHGGGIFNEGSLVTDSVLVEGNVAATVAVSAGGGIYSSGQLAVRNSTVSGNTSQVGGGGIYVSGTSATAAIEDSELRGNVVRDLTTDFRGGGGLHVVNGDATVRRTRIVENSTDYTGGGVTVRGSSSVVDIADSTISGNTSTYGAGIRTQSSGRLTLRGSTISSNTAGRGGAALGGGLRASAPVTIANSTFTGNAAVSGGSFNSGGGAISVDSSVTLDSVTIVGNSADFGGGIASYSTGTTRITNTILAGNTAAAAANGNDCGGTLAGGDALLIGVTTGCTLSAMTGVIVGDPLLGPLQDNGGTTLTLEPQPGSVAIDAGGTALATDQRGFARPAGAAPDIGAVEVQVSGNNPPQIEPIADASVDEGQLIEITPVVSDAEGDPFTLSWVGVPSGASTDGGTFSWTPDESQGPGSYPITVRATQDGDPALFDEESFTITVTEPGDAVAPGWTSPTLTTTSVLATEVSIEWSGASDNVAVTGYEVEVDGSVALTVPASQLDATLTALSPATRYRISVQAVDGAGNRSTDGPSTEVTTLPALPGNHLFPPADSPSIAWQAVFPMGELDAARALGEIVVVASSGSSSPVLQTVGPEDPTSIDIDRDGAYDILVTVSLVPGPGISPAVVMSVDRLAHPGLQDVQVVALVPLPESMSTEVGKTSLAVGFGTAAPGGGAGGYLPEAEVITASIDEIGGLTHRVQLRFETTNEINPLVFYIGSAEGNARDLGATAASLLAIQASPVPSQVDLSLGVDIAALAAPEPAGRSDLEWRVPPGEADPDVTFFYLESERVPRGTAADVDLRGVIEDIDPITRLTVSLVPDESLELALYHNDPSNDFPNGTRYDTIDRIGLEYRQPGFDLDAGLVGLTGPDLLLTLDDGTGDLTVTNTRPFELELEASRRGHGFFGDAFGHAVDWIFVSASDFDTLVISDAAEGGTDVTFSDRFGPGGDLVFVAADDPTDLRFPARQSFTWPSTHPSQWQPISSGPRLVRLGLVDDEQGTTLALRTNDTQSIALDYAAASLAQTIAIGTGSETRLDIDVELGPRPAVPDGAVLGCDAQLRAGAVTIDIAPPSTFGFISGGGTDLDCFGENVMRSVAVTADEFPERMTAELHTADEAGELVFTAVDRTLADDPVDNLRIRLTDIADGLTGDEPLGAPAQLLELSAGMLPSTLVAWSHQAEGDLELSVLATSVEDRIRELAFMLVTIPEAIDAEGSPVFTPSLEPPQRGAGSRGFLPAREASVYLWELPEMTMLAAGVDFGRRLEATIAADGAATVELEVGDDFLTEMPLVVDLALPAGGHYLPAVGVRGWCDLSLPLGTITFDARLPDSLTLDASATAPFSSLLCRQRVSREAPAFDAEVVLDAHVLPDGTRLAMDLAARTVTLSADGGSIGDLLLEVQDRSDSGLPGESPFSVPLGALGIRVDDAESMTGSWEFEAAGDGAGSVLIDLSAAAADAVQFRTTTDQRPDPIPEAGPAHRLELVEEGPDGLGLVLVTLRHLERAQVRHDPDLELPLNVEISSAQAHDLALDVQLDFDSPLTLTNPGTDAPYQIDAWGLVGDLGRSIQLSTNLEDHHVVNRATGADLSAHIALDDDPTDEEDADPALEVFLVATDLPSGFGLRAYNFDADSAAAEPGYVQLTASLPLLDVVLLDPRAAGVLGSGSNRVHVRAEQVPTYLEFQLDNQIADDGTGSFELRGAASGRIGSLLFEADNFVMPGNERHFDTPFARITADLGDVPPAFAVQLEIGSVPDLEDARSMLGDLIFSDGPVPATGPDANDRIGRVEVLLETRNRGLDTDRGLPLLTYADAGFTSLERSHFVRRVDDAYWPAGVRTRLNQSEAGFGLATTTTTPAPAADGQGAAFRTGAVDDYVILGDPTDAGWEFIAVQVSNVHRVSVDSATPELDARVVRPAGTVAPPLYLAIERQQLATYKALPRKPKTGSPDPRAPGVADDSLYQLYTGARVDEIVLNVLANDPDLSAASNYIVSRQPEHGSIAFDLRTIRGEQRRVLVYEPANPHRLGWDLAMYKACTADGACAEARVEILVTDQYVGGVFGRIAGPPNDLTIFTTGHLELEEIRVVDDEEVRVYATVIDQLGYSAATAPTGIDLFSGPRIEPVKSIVPALRVHGMSAPTSLTWHATSPDAYLFRYKADATGPFDLAGVLRTRAGLTRFGARGTSGFELGGAATGFIGQAITGERTPEEFRGCDRIFGRIDTCVAIIGINVQGEAAANLDGFVSFSPPTETTPQARTAGAAELEYVPLITLLTDDLRRISGSAQLQFDPIRFGAFISGPFQVESSFRPVASRLKLDLWARGALAAKVLFPTFSAFDIPLDASYLTGVPFPVIPATPFDPYR